MTRHVVMFSGGIGSWAAAKRVVARHGIHDVTLLFTDVKNEDHDLYRFLPEGAANIGVPVTTIADGRNIWQVFHDERLLGNSRMDPCSKLLKRRLADRWLKANCDPANTIVYVGIDWSEINRFDDGAGGGLGPRRAAQGWRYEAPMCDRPFLDRQQILRWMREEGIKPPRLYELGFSHNNCGGGCVKAGQGHFAHLLRTLPDIYAKWEENEEIMRQFLARDVSMLQETICGMRRNLTLRQLRERIQKGGQIDMFEIGGCNCFLPESDDEAS